MTDDELKEFFKEAEKSYYYDVYRFALATGCRIGEIGGLKNCDISNNEINIRRTVTKDVNSKLVLGQDAKTKAGRRVIPRNAKIAEILDHQREINKVLDGEDAAFDDTIFKSYERRILKGENCARDIARICKRTGIEYFTMHAFRATFATKAIAGGINPRTIQEILGHKDYAITMNLYGHVLDDAKRQAMDQMNSLSL